MLPCLTYHSSFLFFSCHRDPLHLHSFPTRRSSDLESPARVLLDRPLPGRPDDAAAPARRGRAPGRAPGARGPGPEPGFPVPRSEEHTSELQSQFHLVCRLLLEKKKNKNVGLTNIVA